MVKVKVMVKVRSSEMVKWKSVSQSISGRYKVAMAARNLQISIMINVILAHIYTGHLWLGRGAIATVHPRYVQR